MVHSIFFVCRKQYFVGKFLIKSTAVIQGMFCLPHLKALWYGKDDSRELSSVRTINIHQGVLKSGNLLHKPGIIDSQFGTTIALSKN